MRKKYKAFILVLISLFTVINLNQALACIGGDYVDVDNMSMFYDGLMRQDDLRIYLPSFHYYYSGYSIWDRNLAPVNDTTEDEQNIIEWQQHFKGKFSATQLRKIIYTDTAAALVMFAKQQPKNLQADFDYIVLAKKTAALVNDEPGWWVEPKPVKNYEPFIENAKAGFADTKDKFLKYRYGYLVQKLLYADNKYEQAAAFYEKNMAAIDIGGTMQYRTLDYYAGTLYHLQKYAQSNYLFARIFNEYPARQYTSYINFRPQNEDDWQGTLAMAKNDSERETLWFLFGLHADISQAMQKIWQINPSSRYLELLLMRAVKMIENSSPDIWKYSGHPDEYNDMETGDHTNYYENTTDTFYIQNIFGSDAIAQSAEKEQLTTFISTHAADNKIQNKWLWKIAGTYLTLMNHDYEKAGVMLQEAAQNTGTDTLKLAQTHILQLVLKLKTMHRVTAHDESEILALINNLPLHGQYADANALYFCMNSLQQQYLRQGDSLKAALCVGDVDYYRTADAYEKLVKAEAFYRRADLSPFEHYLVKTSGHSIADLVYAQAEHKFYNYDFEGSVKDLSREWQTLPDLQANPFNDRIIDCHDCDQEAPKKQTYNLLTLSKKLVEIKHEAETAKDNASRSRNYLLLANALYNTSYFGNCRMISSTFLFNAGQNLYGEYYTYNDSTNRMPWHETNYTNCIAANNYYGMAAQYAADNETKARCTWMQAKCQLNNFYSSTEFSDNKAFYASQAYQQMKSSYQNTAYYKEVIEQCEYFDKYMGVAVKKRKE